MKESEKSARESEGLDIENANGEEGQDIGEEQADDTTSSDLDVVQNELESLRDRHIRLVAEFDNFRRRSQGEMRECAARAQAALAGKLIEVLDDFARVVALDPEGASVESILEGVTLVERKLFRTLEEAGLEELDPVGDSFDPNVMEALVRVPADSSEEDDMVDQVFQRGFRFGGHLVRPARVSVRKYE